jgi:hypothetical protein
MAATFVSLTATKQVKVGLGKLKGIFVSSGTAPTVAVYDSATASTADPVILNTFTSATPGLQEELDAIVGKRLAREQRKWEREQARTSRNRASCAKASRL